MAHKPAAPRKAHRTTGVGKAEQVDMTAGLRKLSELYAAPEGTSRFAIALEHATKDDVQRVKDVIGPIDQNLLVELYYRTQNVLWLWITVATARKPEDIPLEAFAYLHTAGKEFFAGVVKQACAIEKLHVISGKEDIEEAVVRRSEIRPTPPDVLEVLRLSQPGRSLFQAAAKNIRDGNMAVIAEDRARKGSRSRDEIYADMAKAFGRTSAKVGPATGSIKQLVIKGKKLLSTHPTRKRG